MSLIQPLPDPQPELPGKNWPSEFQSKKTKARVDSNWKNIADVDWEDLEFYIANARKNPNKADFDTATRVLAALQRQLLEGKK